MREGVKASFYRADDKPLVFLYFRNHSQAGVTVTTTAHHTGGVPTRGTLRQNCHSAAFFLPISTKASRLEDLPNQTENPHKPVGWEGVACFCNAGAVPGAGRTGKKRSLWLAGSSSKVEG